MEREKAIQYFNELAKETKKKMIGSRKDQLFYHIPGSGGKGITFKLQPEESYYKPYCRFCDVTLCDMNQNPGENVYGITELKRCSKCHTTFGFRYV
jgi:hypothetical protein